jgi:hypothetical protein
VVEDDVRFLGPRAAIQQPQDSCRYVRTYVFVSRSSRAAAAAAAAVATVLDGPDPAGIASQPVSRPRGCL